MNQLAALFNNDSKGVGLCDVSRRCEFCLDEAGREAALRSSTCVVGRRRALLGGREELDVRALVERVVCEDGPL